MKHLVLLLLFTLALTGGAYAQLTFYGDCSTPINARPNNVSAQAVGHHKAVIRWQGVPGAKGYAVNVGLSDIDPKGWPTFLTCDPNEEYTVEGLTPGQTYRARVRTLCGDCGKNGGPTVSPWSFVVEFTTPNDPQTPAGPSNPTDPNAPVAGRYAIAGQVIDAWHRPVEGARVKRGSVESLTDAKGRFTLAVNEARPAETTPVLVVVEKDGYWRNASRQYLHAQETTETAIMLREKTVTNRVDATQGGEMLYKHFSLQLPPNGVQTEDGTPYRGTILLSVDGATPSERDFGLRMPGGDFSVIDESGNDVMLYSYGFLSAEMTTESGQKLEFRPGAEATLRFNLPWDEQDRPDRVPLWHFNETTALWEQEGWSVKNGSTYEGKVSHFSSWNCDRPFNHGLLRGQVKDCNGEPVKNAWVNVGQRLLIANVYGIYSAFMPTGMVIDISTQSDTIRGILVPFHEEVILPDLMSGLSFGGLGVWHPTTKILNAHFSGNFPDNLRVSIDDGLTWTVEREWTGVATPPLKILLDVPCPAHLQVVALPHKADCRKLSKEELSAEPMYWSIQTAVNADRAYKLDLDSTYTGAGDWIVLKLLTCLQSLKSSQLSTSTESSTYLEGVLNLTNLQSLTLLNKQLTALPQNFGNLTGMRELYLSNNLIAALPESIGNLSALKTLYLNSNQLTALPESIGNLSSLKNLYLAYNQLTSLPQSIGNLSALQDLILPNNQLTTLPISMGDLDSLEYLALYNNQLTDLPASIANLADTLTELVLIGNPIPVERRAAIQSLLPNTTIYW